MMQISHAATGAAVGKFMPNPVLAFLAGILIHLVIDKIPHYWPISDKKLKGVLLIWDYFFTIIFIITIVVTDYFSLNILMGMAGSLIIDIFLVGPKKGRDSAVGIWHSVRQKHLFNPATFFADIVVITIGALIVFGT